MRSAQPSPQEWAEHMLTLEPSTRVLNPWGSGGLLCSYWEAPAQRQFGIRITCCSHTRQDMWKGCYMTTSFEGFFFFFSEQWVFTDLNTLDFTTCKVPNKATENQIHKQLWRFQIPFHPCSVQRLDGIHSERRKAQLPPLSQNDCVEEIGGSKMKPQSRWGMQRAMSNLGRAVSWMRGKRAPEDAMGWAGREVFDSPWEWVLEWEKVIGDLWPSGRVSKGCNRIKEAREGLGAKWAADAPCPHGTATAQLQLPVLHARCGQVFYGFRRDWQSRFSCENQG